MNGFRRKLNRELDRIVRNMPSEFSPAPKKEPGQPEKTPLRRAPWVRWASAVAACAVLLAVILPFALRTGAPVSRTGSVILMEINPAVHILTDENDRVVGVTSANRDGDLLLADSAFSRSLIGKTAGEAAVSVADRAFSMGFIRESGENAVRLSVAGDTKDYAEETETALTESLVAYFCEKGIWIPVLTRTAEAAEFGDGSLSETVAAMAARATTLTEDAAKHIAPEEIGEQYRGARLAFTAEITDYIDQTASGKKALLAELTALNEAILQHEDNPGLLFRDYWSLRDSDKTFTAAFAALMTRMEQKAETYERLYDQALDSYAVFGILSAWYEALDLGQLRESLAAFNRMAETLDRIFDVSFLTNLIGGDDAMEAQIEHAFDSVTEIPATVGEYADSVMTMLIRSAELALEKNRAAYEAPREPLAAADYQAKMRDLEEKYGSLENFWNSFNKTAGAIV